MSIWSILSIGLYTIHEFVEIIVFPSEYFHKTFCFFNLPSVLNASLSVPFTAKHFFMKRFLFLVCVYFCVFFGNAQVINGYGQYVVRKIDIYFVNETKPYISIDFNYSNSLKLEEVIFFAPATGKVIWKKDGDNLTRTEYNEDGKLRKDLVYHYELTNDLVTKCTIDNIGIEGNVLRHSYVYQYNNRKIAKAERHDYFREGNEDFVELSDRYREVFEWDCDDNVYTTTEKGWQWKIGQKFDYPILYENREYYNDYSNNSNIDLSLLYQNIGNFDRFEMVTEWFGEHSSYLIESDNNIGFDFSFDNKCVILEMKEFNQFKKLKRIYKIYYWE